MNGSQKIGQAAEGILVLVQVMSSVTRHAQSTPKTPHMRARHPGGAGETAFDLLGLSDTCTLTRKC